MIRAIAALVIAAAGLAGTASAGAHDGEGDPNPPDGSSVACPLTEVSVAFDDAVSDVRIELTDPSGTRVDGTVATDGERRVRYTIDAMTTTGTYALRWFALAADGHPATGESTFEVTDDCDDDGPPLGILAGAAVVVVAVAGAVALRRRRPTDRRSLSRDHRSE